MENTEKQQSNDKLPTTRYSLRWGNTPHNLNMVFISNMVDNSQKAIDEFYDCYPEAFCDHPKPYNI